MVNWLKNLILSLALLSYTACSSEKSSPICYSYQQTNPFQKIIQTNQIKSIYICKIIHLDSSNQVKRTWNSQSRGYSEWKFDSLGRFTDQRNLNSGKATYQYDSLGFVLKTIRQVCTIISYVSTYEIKDKQLIRKQFRFNDPLYLKKDKDTIPPIDASFELQTIFEYDSLSGFLTKEKNRYQDISYKYDSKGRLIEKIEVGSETDGRFINATHNFRLQRVFYERNRKLKKKSCEIRTIFYYEKENLKSFEEYFEQELVSKYFVNPKSLIDSCILYIEEGKKELCKFQVEF